MGSKDTEQLITMTEEKFNDRKNDNWETIPVRSASESLPEGSTKRSTSRRKKQQQQGSSTSSWSKILATELGVQGQDDLFSSLDTTDESKIQDCDPRLSRAARFRVHQLLVHFLSLYSKQGNSLLSQGRSFLTQQDNATAVVDLLLWLLPSRSVVPSCPLHPENDVLGWEMQHSKKLDARKLRSQWTKGHQLHSHRSSNLFLLSLPTKGYSCNPHMYQCTICQKIFSTQYYLDQHMKTRHSFGLRRDSSPLDHDEELNRTASAVIEKSDATAHSNSSVRSLNHHWTCPATDWCPFLIPTCHETALTLEPYYGKGSEGRRNDDRILVANQLWKQAHQQPCTQSKMKQAQRSCRKLIETCFVLPTTNSTTTTTTTRPHQDSEEEWLLLLSALAEFWETRVCAPLSCPNQFHRLYFSAHQHGHAVVRHVHDWQDEWKLHVQSGLLSWIQNNFRYDEFDDDDEEMRMMRIRGGSRLVVLVLLVFMGMLLLVLWKVGYCTWCSRQRRPKPAATRLLKKSSSVSVKRLKGASVKAFLTSVSWNKPKSKQH